MSAAYALETRQEHTKKLYIEFLIQRGKGKWIFLFIVQRQLLGYFLWWCVTTSKDLAIKNNWHQGNKYLCLFKNEQHSLVYKIK